MSKWHDPEKDPPKAGMIVLVCEKDSKTPRTATIEELPGANMVIAILDNYPEHYNKRAMSHLIKWTEIPCAGDEKI